MARKTEAKPRAVERRPVGKDREEGWVYLLAADDGSDRVKIGVSKLGNLVNRIRAINAAGAERVAFVHGVYVRLPYMVEGSLHGQIASYRQAGEWFQLTVPLVQQVIAEMDAFASRLAVRLHCGFRDDRVRVGFEYCRALTCLNPSVECDDCGRGKVRLVQDCMGDWLCRFCLNDLEPPDDPHDLRDAGGAA